MNINKVFIAGRLTRDPELRYTPNNTAVCEIGLAVNRKYKTPGGETKEETTFVDCTAWGRTAEVINEYVRKGDPLHVEGRIREDKWEDKDGNNRSKLKVVVESIQLLGGKPQGQRDQGRRQQQTTNTGRDARPPIGEEDIPF